MPPMNKRTPRFPLALLLAVIFSACSHTLKKKDWTAAPAEADEAACEAHGGKLIKLADFEPPTCVTPFPDGGKPCADGSECVGGCYYYSTPHPTEPPKKKKGVCQRNNYFRECYREVKDDVIEPGSHCPA